MTIAFTIHLSTLSTLYSPTTMYTFAPTCILNGCTQPCASFNKTGRRLCSVHWAERQLKIAQAELDLEQKKALVDKAEFALEMLTEGTTDVIPVPPISYVDSGTVNKYSKRVDLEDASIVSFRKTKHAEWVCLTVESTQDECLVPIQFQVHARVDDKLHLSEAYTPLAATNLETDLPIKVDRMDITPWVAESGDWYMLMQFMD